MLSKKKKRKKKKKASFQKPKRGKAEGVRVKLKIIFFFNLIWFLFGSGKLGKERGIESTVRVGHTNHSC